MRMFVCTKKLIGRNTICVVLTLMMALGATPAQISAAAVTDGDFAYRVISDGYCAITGYSGDETDIVIPGAIDGYVVREIDLDAFVNNAVLVSVIIPDSVTVIWDSAFSGCGSLKSVIIQDGVESIENGAFFGCGSLASVFIPYSVVSIGEGAFDGCSENFAIHCYKDSYAQQYAIANGILHIEDGDGVSRDFMETRNLYLGILGGIANTTISGAIAFVAKCVLYLATIRTIQELQSVLRQETAADKARLTWDAIRGSNATHLGVTANLAALPTVGSSGSTISWHSSDPATVSDTGAVTRPAAGEGDKSVVLTATLTKGESVRSAAFKMMVLAYGAGTAFDIAWENNFGGNNRDGVWKKDLGGNARNGFISAVATDDGIVAVGYSVDYLYYHGREDFYGHGIENLNDYGRVGLKDVDMRGNMDELIVKFDNSGNMIWANLFGGSGNDYFGNVAAVPDGIVAVGVSGEH